MNQDFKGVATLFTTRSRSIFNLPTSETNLQTEFLSTKMTSALASQIVFYSKATVSGVKLSKMITGVQKMCLAATIDLFFCIRQSRSTLATI